ncbi:glycosyltransferase family 2 protein [Dialister sp.]|uniref:glycosyltransferase family 2 protein n=1 Tax=Dialister sp. TaxID=1955814 RepID=UPI002E8074B7|nr:glycosyltransferase family 2 protein [Dialister sp.]MEE3452623.1 glycosyltransferase family 2 protein [Dialister sp.]
MDRIAVLVPCWNEVLTIEKVVKDFKRVLPEAVIYVYDNNSTDGTAELAIRAGAVVRHEYRQGKGNVIRSMFRDIDADCYVMVDGDDTYSAENARDMVNLVLEGKADMVIGDRLSSTYFEENKRPFHNSGNVLVRRFINMFWGENACEIKDVMTGYRALSPMFVKTFPILSKGFEIETEMTIHALDKNLLLANVPVTYRDRPKGSVSKLHTFRDGIKVLKTIFMLYKDYRPLRFFSITALLLAFISLILFIPVFHEYMVTGLVPKMPTLVTSGFFMMAALVSFGIGLVLDTEVKNARKNLEIQMNMIRILLRKS